MKKVFISYRRSDSSETKRMAAFLKKEIGAEKIFFDQELFPGNVWPESIKNALHDAAVMLLVIGPNWLLLQDERSGKRRIDLDNDWVRIEILTFLERMKSNNGLALIPVLVNNAIMPKKEYLDDQLAPISDFQEFKLEVGKLADFTKLKAMLAGYGFPFSPPLVSTPVQVTPPSQLSAEEENAFLKEHTDWKIVEEEKPDSPGDIVRELYRIYEFTNYQDAWRFMAKVDENAIRHLNHHPRWQNTWNRVEFWLCTFNIGHKPSVRDIKLAELVEKIWKEFPGN